MFITFIAHRGPRWNRSNFVLLTLFNISLLAVSIEPDILNALRDALSLQEAFRGRIIALLIVSNIFLVFYIFFTRLKLENIHHQFDKLVRSLGSRGIENLPDLRQQIKPIMILIPAYNEEENLKELLPHIPRTIDGREVNVLVVDDGSEDETFEMASQTPGVCIVKNMINRGGGAALRLGYDVLQKAGTKICVTMDADGQHRPEDIRALVLPILKEDYDCVIGSRILGDREKSSWLRISGVYVFGRLISLLVGKKITDPSSGFRAFRMDAMQGVNLHEDQFHTSELIIEAVKKGLQIVEVPITILRRKHGKSKKGRDLAYGFHFARIIFKTWWR
jgi:GT2 family glycosyltransferase